MKKIFTLIFLAVLFLPQTRAAGGPDAYGYTWIASTDGGGPAFQMIDISTIGTVVSGLADDNSAVGTFAIGFPFHYYWSDYTDVKIGSNGWLSFNAATSNIASCFPTIPTAGGAGDNILAALMGDLNFLGAGNIGQCYTWTNNVDSFIVMYKNVPFWIAAAPNWGGSNTFEIILNGADSSITYMYGALGGLPLNAGCVDLTVGIENSTGSIGLQVFSDASPPSNYAVRFEYPNVVLLAVRDLSANWNTDSSSGGVFYPTGTFEMIANVKNVGNTPVSTSTTVAGAIKNLALATVTTSNFTLPTLAAAEDTTIHFTTLPNITTVGTYYFETNAPNATDINPGNNLRRSEVGIRDLCNPTMQLSYVTGNTATGTINWNGGAIDDGVGVYYEPPVYPATVSSIEFFISNNSSDGYIARVRDDDGGLGVPGTLLFGVTVPNTSVVAGTWNLVPVNPPVVITSGGFYVNFMQGGTTIFLGTENTGPMSLRNKEVLDNAWAEFRFNTTQDLMIRANLSGYPTSSPAGFTHVVSGNNVAFSNTTAGGTAYAWDFGDLTTSTAWSPTHIYANPGLYPVCLTVSSACASNTFCDTIYICGDPVANFGQSIAGTTVTFSDSSLNFPNSYYWDFGDGATDTVASPTHTYPTVGLYTACLIVNNLCGNDTTCFDVPTCPAPAADFSWNGTGTFYSFTDNSNGLITDYLWDFGDGIFVSTQNPSHTYQGCGTYNVCLTVTDTCGNIDSTCNSFTIDIPPVAMYSFTQNSLTVNCSDLSTGSGSVTSWAWDFGDGVTSTLQNPTHTYNTGGSYTICLTVTDSCGSDDTCMPTTLTTLDEMIAITRFQVFPNPTDGYFTIEGEMDNGMQVSISLSDLAGREVVFIPEQDWSGHVRKTLDLSAQPAGVYFGTLQSGGSKLTFKIMKE
jgi:PKD repeat protein